MLCVITWDFLILGLLYPMGDWISLKPILDEVVVVEEEEDLVADAQRIVRALVTRRNLTRNSRKILADLGTQLCSISEITESKTMRKRA